MIHACKFHIDHAKAPYMLKPANIVKLIHQGYKVKDTVTCHRELAAQEYHV